MKFSLVVNMERHSPSEDMRDITRHIVEMAQIADEGGFEIIWAAEHHAIEATIAPAPFQLLAWIAAHTNQIRLGTGVIVAPYWHPIKLAGEAALLDILSGGRLEFGIGRGAYQREFDRMVGGIPQEEGVAYMKEMLPAVLNLWQGDYKHEGHYWSFPEATSVPKPLQKPRPPVWVAARDPGTFEWAVAHDCNIMSWAMFKSFAEVESLHKKYEDAVAKNGGKKRPRFTTSRATAVYESKADWEEPIKALLRNSARFEALYKGLGDTVNGFTHPVELASLTNRAEFEPKLLSENMMFGTPDEIIAKLRRHEALGIDGFFYMASFGPSLEYQKKSLKLFVKEVMPEFKSRTKSSAA